MMKLRIFRHLFDGDRIRAERAECLRRAREQSLLNWPDDAGLPNQEISYKIDTHAGLSAPAYGE